MPCSAGARSREERVNEWKPADAEVGSSEDQEAMAAASPGHRIKVVSPLDTYGQVPTEGRRVNLSGAEVQRCRGETLRCQLHLQRLLPRRLG